MSRRTDRGFGVTAAPERGETLQGPGPEQRWERAAHDRSGVCEKGANPPGSANLVSGRPPEPLRRSRLSQAPERRTPIPGSYQVSDPESTAVFPSARPSGPVDADADTYFRLAEEQFERGNVRAAVLLAQKGRRLGQPTPDQQALYAWLLYQRSGGTAEAALPQVWEYLDDALGIDPDCVRAHYYKGLLLEHCGRRVEAHTHIVRATELDPNHVGANAALREMHKPRR